jgi:hypothetical protein
MYVLAEEGTRNKVWADSTSFRSRFKKRFNRGIRPSQNASPTVSPPQDEINVLWEQGELRSKRLWASV